MAITSIVEIKPVSDNPTAAEVSVDLSEYINAYYDERVSRQDFNRIKNQIIALVFVRGLYHFMECFELAYRNMPLSQDEFKELSKSPAYAVLSRTFGEIIKNTVDAQLTIAKKEYHESGVVITPLIASVLCEVEDDGVHDKISLTLTDNGPGFKPELLSEIATSDTRRASQYIFTKGSVKTRYHNETSDIESTGKKLLFGGAGQALKDIIGFADYGDYGYKHKLKVDEGEETLPDGAVAELPDVTTGYELVFGNCDSMAGEHSGAVIRLTTPKSPLRSVSVTTVQSGSTDSELETIRSNESSPTLTDDEFIPLKLPSLAERRDKTRQFKRTLGADKPISSENNTDESSADPDEAPKDSSP